MRELSDAVVRRFHVRWQLGVVLLFNTLVGLVLGIEAGTRYGPGTWWKLLAYTHLVGFSTLAAVSLLSYWAGRLCRPSARELVLGILGGALVGNLLGTLLIDGFRAEGVAGFAGCLVISIAFGGFGAYFFLSMAHLAQSEVDLGEQRMRALASEHALAATHLRLLQAQIEPHFLFNTLSNIDSLIDTHPQRAAHMLEALTQLLRATLKRTREGTTTLGEEMALVRAYLEIQQARMGERLRFELHVPDTLTSVPLPPLLIQPLVENAVQHGLEGAVEGGTVIVRAACAGEALEIQVCDSGGAPPAERKGHGLGLDNVRGRLAALYGDNASLRVERDPRRGVDATLRVPLRIAQEAHA